MSKEIATSEDDLEALMNMLEESIATAEAAPPAPAPAPVAAPVQAPAPIPEPPKKEEVVTAATTTIVPAAPVSAPVVTESPEQIVVEEPTPAPTPTPAVGANFQVDPEQFRRDIALDETNLDAAMMQQASLRAYYGTVAAQAEGHAARTKAKFEILEAKLFDEHEKALAAKGEKTTQAKIDAAVKNDPRWFAGKNKVIEAETVASVNKSLTFALADRRDMLIQLGSDRREEFKGQLRINEGQSLGQRASEIGRRIANGG
jgi:hypothetical protein